MKANIDGKSIEIINEWYTWKKREEKAAREIRKQRIYDVAAEGIDPEIAALMVDFNLC